MRMSLKESPTFIRLKALKRVCVNPLKSAMEHSRPTLLIGIGLRLGENGGSSIYQALAVSYIVGVVGLQGPVDEPRDAWEIASAATAMPVQARTSTHTPNSTSTNHASRRGRKMIEAWRQLKPGSER
ncbi:hypothetical protein PS862_04459 [Pseudomonas fluorescens]|uniref:Uncharacterized protein n=1 Tax=Pseudomonas fluorescens TaxID=294 RepID=A0A5E6TRE9_PSEFL|nr:hypothetical protein PS639_03026 [Pseudomonas fluorescens]VVP32740.1 hypothetical protein PS862_04459 [Pseudomonas fluorescens]